MVNERCAGSDAEDGTTCEEYFLERKSAMVVVGQVGTGSGLASGGEEFFAFVLTVVDLNVVGIKFGQIFEEAWPMAVLSVSYLAGNGPSGMGSIG